LFDRMPILPDRWRGRPASLRSRGRPGLEFDPDRRVVARLPPASHLAIDASRLEARGDRRAQQQVVDAQSSVSGVGVTEIIPECVYALAGMQRSQGVGPTLCGKPAKRVSHLDAKQRVVDPSPRLMD